MKGVRTRRQEISHIERKSPSCLSLQELKLPSNSQYRFNNQYKSYLKLPNDNNEFPRDDTMVAVKHNIPYTLLQINTPLQAVAISFSIGDLRPICSVYLPPIEQISALQIEQLIGQLPKPTMIVRDMNAHNPCGLMASWMQEVGCSSQPSKQRTTLS